MNWVTVEESNNNAGASTCHIRILETVIAVSGSDNCSLQGISLIDLVPPYNPLPISSISRHRMRSILVLLGMVADLVAGTISIDDLSSTWNSVLQKRIFYDRYDLVPWSHQIQRRSGEGSPRSRSPSPSPRPNIVTRPLPRAGVRARGPAYIKTKNAGHNGEPYRYIWPGNIGDEGRGHPAGAYAAGVLPPHRVQLESDQPVKVIATGHTARVHVITGPGSRGIIQTASPETGMQEFAVPADSTRTETMTSLVPGGAQVRATVYRPGKAEAFALGGSGGASRSGSNELLRRHALGASMG